MHVLMGNLIASIGLLCELIYIKMTSYFIIYALQIEALGIVWLGATKKDAVFSCACICIVGWSLQTRIIAHVLACMKCVTRVEGFYNVLILLIHNNHKLYICYRFLYTD